jgi:hypothetical protein
MGIAFVRDRSPIEIFLSLLTKKKSNWGTDPVRVDSLQIDVMEDTPTENKICAGGGIGIRASLRN